MSFAAPLALLLSFLAVPVVLLYLLKQRRRRLRVSTLLFWEQVLRDEHAVTSYTRLRKYLSLLLQLLVIALLTLALARPLLSRDLPGQRRIVLILDTSASMHAEEEHGTRFDQALAQARAAVRGMGMGDELMLVTLADRADVALPFTDNRRVILNALEGIEPGHTGTNLAAAFSLLEGLPPDKRETHVFVVSDGAANPPAFNPPEGMRFAWRPVGETRKNVGITVFQLRPRPGAPSDFEILLEAGNFSGEPVSFPYELRIEGNLVDAGQFDLAPDARERTTLQQFSNQGGVVEARLDYEDAFRLDNVAYAVLPPPTPVPVQLVTEGNLFLESALATDEGVSLDVAAPDAYAEAPEARPGLVRIFDRWSPDTPPPGNAIYLGAWPAAFGVATEGALEKPLISDWKRDDPVMRGLNLTNVSVWKARRITEPGSFTALITSFEQPLLLERKNDATHTLLFAFDTQASDLPLRVAFPLLLANAVRDMAGIGTDEAWAARGAGGWITRQEAEALAAKRFLPTGDGGGFVRLLGPGETGDTQAEAPGPFSLARAGVYSVLQADGDVAPLLAVNLNNPRESDIAPAEALPVTSSTPVPAVSAGFRLTFRPWVLLAGFAVLLLLAEWLLFHRRIVE